MDVMQVSGAAGARQVNRMDGRHFLKPDSALVRAALDLLATHVADAAAGTSPRCGQCGRYFPCPTVENARQVVVAGGGLVTVAGRLEQKISVASTRAQVGDQGVPETVGDSGVPEAADESREQVAAGEPREQVAVGDSDAPEAVGEPREQVAADDARESESESAVAPTSGGPAEAAPVDSISAVPTGLIAQVTHIVTQRVPEAAGQRVKDGSAEANKKHIAHDPVGAA